MKSGKYILQKFTVLCRSHATNPSDYLYFRFSADPIIMPHGKSNLANAMWLAALVSTPLSHSFLVGYQKKLL